LFNRTASKPTGFEGITLEPVNDFAIFADLSNGLSDRGLRAAGREHQRGEAKTSEQDSAEQEKN
jgi:hypothetical protein